MAAVGNWFFVGAGVAIGIASAGQAFGQGAVPFVSSLLIDNFGISGAFASIGGFMLVTLIPLTILLRQPPALGVAQHGINAEEENPDIPTNVVIGRLSAGILLCCNCWEFFQCHFGSSIMCESCAC